MKKMSLNIAILLLIFGVSITVYGANSPIDMKIFKNMKARSIGPAGMSGRIAAIEAVDSDPDIIYIGAATGGLWKSADGGTTWEPIFDDQPASGIGSIAVYQKNPNIVWVGTGEGNLRNSMGIGYGIFKSIDGGRSWKHLGLKKTERIYRILLDPNDPDIAYAAALGKAWGPNEERGVFKTIDGGDTWEKILYIDENTGCGELVMDPSNPNKLFASMWEYRRWPWFFKSGGKGSGFYVTYDGGESWAQIDEKMGMLKGPLGRTGIAIAPNNPDVVYALVEAKKSALLRSDDGGHRWKIINQTPYINSRPFYYCDIHVDPENENRLYSLHTELSMSEDGGKSFHVISRDVHLDHHALWINPQDGKHLIDGNDGGVAISRDRGRTWRFVANLPVGQFYHINIDQAVPYNIYGGMQDNGSWRGPAYVWETGGIMNHHWIETSFGDGFGCLVDPDDPERIYTMSQQGNLMRFNVRTGERRSIKPDAPDGVKLRFNWNAPIAIDPFDAKVVYYGSQFVHKTEDNGNSWEIISPDLTTNDPEKQKSGESGGLTYDASGAENHTTILTIAPSPVEQGIIWVGTDDGNIHVSRNSGKTWTNVGGNIKGIPAYTWCPHIEPSKFNAGTAYAVFDDHRRSNWETYIFKTDDFGNTWENLAKNDPTAGKKDEVWGFAHVIEEDFINKDLLFLGTEFGLWVSFDGGTHWNKWTHGVPTVPVRALIIHPREHDLVIGTHGRATFVLDDIRPLREMSRKIQQKAVYLFEIPSTYIHHTMQSNGSHFLTQDMFQGENRPYGAMISYWCRPFEIEKSNKKDSPDKKKTLEIASSSLAGGGDPAVSSAHKTVSVEIMDEDGNVIRKSRRRIEEGINRFYWNLRIDSPKTGEGGARQMFMRPATGAQVIPGKYTVSIKAGEEESTRDFEVLPDPRENISIEDRKARFELVKKHGKHISLLNDSMARTREAMGTLNRLLEQTKKSKEPAVIDIRKAAMNVKKSLEKYRVSVYGDNKVQGFNDRSKTYMWRISFAGRGFESTFEAPGPSDIIKFRQIEKALEEAITECNRIFAEEVKPLAEKLKQSPIIFFPELEPLELNEEAEKMEKDIK